MSKHIIGIDAFNIINGGGVTHLRELISDVNAESKTIKKIIIWGTEATLSKINENDMLIKKTHYLLNADSLLLRFIWHIFIVRGDILRCI